MLCLSQSIRHDDPSLQQGLQSAYHAANLTELILAAWALARVLAVHVVESVLREWAGRPTPWPPCPECGKALRSKGFAQREVKSLLGVIQGRRRVGRCPEGCEIGPVAPLDVVLGLDPYQRSRGELQYLGCSLAVFVPYATAARPRAVSRPAAAPSTGPGRRRAHTAAHHSTPRGTTPRERCCPTATGGSAGEERASCSAGAMEELIPSRAIHSVRRAVHTQRVMPE